MMDFSFIFKEKDAQERLSKLSLMYIGGGKTDRSPPR